MQIPNNLGQIIQTNIGDYSGQLWESFNLDVSTKPGKIKTSKKLERILTDTQLGTPAGVVDLLIWDSRYILCTEDNMYTCSVTDDPRDSSNWTNEPASADLDINSSAVVFDDGTNSRLRISRDTDIAEWNGAGTYDDDWWTTDKAGTPLTSGVPHMLAVVQSQKETMYVTDGNRVQYIEKDAAASQIVELDSNVTATCLAGGLDGAMWVGTFNETSGNAFVYEIYTNEQVDGTPTYRQAYPVDGRAVLAVWVHNNTPHIVTETGAIQQFNGAGFTTIAHFPFQLSGRHLDGVRAGQIQDSSRARPIHPRGVKTHGSYTYLFINTISEEDDYAPTTRMHSGVWELDHSTNSLVHKFAPISTSDQAGQSSLEGSGPLLITDSEFTFLMCGADVQPSANTEVFAVSSDYGTSYFVTPEKNSQVETDAFLRIIHKASIKNDGEVHTLYRNTSRDTVYGTINWLSDTEFTTTDNWDDVAEGDLVRISHGYGAGHWANVESISASALTWTVTLTRAIGASGQTSYAYSDPFKYIESVYTADDGESKRVGPDKASPWIQIMVIMEGDIEYRMFDLVDGAKSNRK